MPSLIYDLFFGAFLLYLFITSVRHISKGGGELRIVALLCALVLIPSLAVIHWYTGWDFSSGGHLQEASRWWTVPVVDTQGNSHGDINLLVLIPLFVVLYITSTLLLALFSIRYQRRHETPMQNIHRGLFKWLLVVLGIAFYLKTQGVSLTPLLFGVGAVSIVVGLALQEALSNLFSGLEIDVEGNTNPGDWVCIDVDGGTIGMVVDKGWRTTRLLTFNQEFVTLPNKILGNNKIVNYYQPERVHGHMLSVSASYDAPPAKVKDVLRTVMMREPRILKEPSSHVWVKNFADSAVEYEMQFFIDDFSAIWDIKDEVMTRIWYSFRHNDIEIPYPIRTLHMKDRAQEVAEYAQQQQQVAELMAFFKGLPCLNRTLTLKDYEYLALNAVPVDYAPGEPLIMKGTMGDAVFFLRSGWCVASLPDGSSKKLEPGEFIGEMALLNSGPRTADIRAGEEGATGVRVDRESLLRLFRFYPELRECFIVTMNDRQQETGAVLKQEPVYREEPFAVRLRREIKNILYPW